MSNLETSYYRLESSGDEEDRDAEMEDEGYFVHVAEGSKGSVIGFSLVTICCHIN